MTFFSLNSFQHSERHVCFFSFFSFDSTSEKASAVNGENITTFIIVLTAALQAVHYFDLFFNALSVLSNIKVEILEIKREDQQPQYTYSVLLLSVLITKKKNIKMCQRPDWISNTALKPDKCKLKSKVPLMQSWRVSLHHYTLSLECSGPCIN